MVTDEPSVLTWMIAMAPRPPAEPRRHWWREFVTEAWRAAHDQWQLDAEAASVGYATELAEFRAANPAPTLRAFMVHLAQGRWAPDAVLP